VEAHTLEPGPGTVGLSTRIRHYVPPLPGTLPRVRWRAAVTNRTLFFLVEVEDTTPLETTFKRNRIHDGDRLVLFADGDKVALARHKGQTVREAWRGTDRYSVTAIVSRRGGTTVYELALPFQDFVRARPLPLKAPFAVRLFPHLPGPGEAIPFGFAVYDARPGGRWIALAHGPGALENYDEAVLRNAMAYEPDPRFMARLVVTRTKE
jgi:hypothetical protein